MIKTNFFQKVLVISGFFLAVGANANSVEAQNLSLFGRNTTYKTEANCYLRREYNYFMNQWTTNEVCNPRIYEVPEPEIIIPRGANSNQDIVDNVYLGPTTVNTPYTPTVYNAGPSISQTYRGFYANNNHSYSGNDWGGLGSAASYLIGAFSGLIGSEGYANNYYPSSLHTYLPAATYSAPRYTYTAYYDYDYNYNPGYKVPQTKHYNTYVNSQINPPNNNPGSQLNSLNSYVISQINPPNNNPRAR